MNYKIDFTERELAIILTALNYYMYSGKITETQFKIADECLDKISEAIE